MLLGVPVHEDAGAVGAADADDADAAHEGAIASDADSVQLAVADSEVPDLDVVGEYEDPVARIGSIGIEDRRELARSDDLEAVLSEGNDYVLVVSARPDPDDVTGPRRVDCRLDGRVAGAEGLTQ